MFVSAGNSHTMAIREDGSLWAWGNNGDWRLGAVWDDDEMTRSTTPVQVGTATNWAFVAAGERHTVAIRTDGTLWAWGFNEVGQLGDSTTVTRFTPVQVGTGNDWVAVSAGGSHTVATRRDGSLWAWGRKSGINRWGGLTVVRNYGSTPVRVMTPENLVSVSVAAGNGYTVAIGTDGKLWSWGGNNNGQLGDGSGYRRGAISGEGVTERLLSGLYK